MKLIMIIKRRKGKALERKNHNREKKRFRSSCIYGCRNSPKLLRKMKTLVKDLMWTEKKKRIGEEMFMIPVMIGFT